MVAWSLERAKGRRALRHRDRWFVRSLHAGGIGAQMELAEGAPESQEGCDEAQHGNRRERSNRLEKIPSLLRCRAARCTVGTWQLSLNDEASRQTGGRKIHTCLQRIAGQTFTGEDDDFEEIHDWLDQYEKRTGISIPMHIDGASGGFVNPFLYPDYKWDFRLPRVQSINASGHKYGLVPPGLGWVVFKERKVFNEDLIFYLKGEITTATLNFSRNAFRSRCNITSSAPDVRLRLHHAPRRHKRRATP
jgi:hypothetical protein